MSRVPFHTTRKPFAAAKAFTLFLVAAACVSYGETAKKDKDDEELLNLPLVSNSITGPLLNRLIDIGNRAGFEIGNGKKLIKNDPGKYLLKIYDNWEEGKAGAFTEITSPLKEGVPRARMQISVVEARNIVSLRDLQDCQNESTCVSMALGKLEGVQREKRLPNGLREIEVRLFRAPGDILVLQIDGLPGEKELTPFDRAISTLTSFQNLP